MKDEKLFLENVETLLDLSIQHMLNGNQVRAYTSAMLLKEAVLNRISRVSEATA